MFKFSLMIEIDFSSNNILDWTPQYFCEQIGGDCYEVADKFEHLKEIFELKTVK